MGECVAPPIDNRHFLAMNRVAADGCIDLAMRHARGSIAECQIRFLHLARGKLRGKRIMCGLGFRHYETTGSLLVQSMDNAGAAFSADDFQCSAVM